MAKKLFRSQTDKKISGVIGGLAEYLNADASLLRIVFVLLLIFTGFMPMGIVYLVAMAVIPKDDGLHDS